MLLACGCGGLLEAAMVVAAGGMALLTAIWFKVWGFLRKPFQKPVQGTKSSRNPTSRS